MTVTVEVPEGCKFCRDCGEVKPVEGNFHLRKRGNSLRPHSVCRVCMRKRWHQWNNKGRQPAQPVWVRPDYERSCDRAFMQWQGGGPRQDWRVAI